MTERKLNERNNKKRELKNSNLNKLNELKTFNCYHIVKQTTHDGVFDPTGSADSREMS
jgi:hypothetical protein